MVRGYKALNFNMKAIFGDGMHYEIGKWYEMDGKIELYKKGFHFCRKLEDMQRCYELFYSRLFELEADGEIIEASDTTKMVCSKIRLVREILPKEWQTEKNLLKILEIDGYVIRFIEKPTLGVQWEAIKQNGRAIQFIEEPTLEMQLEAVKQEGQAIQYIKNPTVEVQLEAVKQDERIIAFIENPAPEVLTYLQKKH